MAGKRHEGGHAGCCDRADGSCVGLAVRRLSQQRLAELAEEIWTASTGSLLPARPSSDPRSSRPGASARAAYQRCRQQELEARRPGRWWRTGTVVAAAAAAGLLVGLIMGAWLGWAATLSVGVVAGWRLRFRPSRGAIVWRRQAALQRRTAGALQSVAAAIADALANGASIPVRSLLCVHGAIWPGGHRSMEGTTLVTLRRVADLVLRGSPLPAREVERATARALEVLRPAA